VVRAVHGRGREARGQVIGGRPALGAQLGEVRDTSRPGSIGRHPRVPPRAGFGHVGLYVGEDYGAFHVLGGNQSVVVTITRIARDRCIAIRRSVRTAVQN
jgi:hypothetical protein